MAKSQDLGGRRTAKQTSPPRDEVQGWSESIRALYDGVAHEPLPREIANLLDQLKQKNGK